MPMHRLSRRRMKFKCGTAGARVSRCAGLQHGIDKCIFILMTIYHLIGVVVVAEFSFRSFDANWMSAQLKSVSVYSISIFLNVNRTIDGTYGTFSTDQLVDSMFSAKTHGIMETLMVPSSSTAPNRMMKLSETNWNLWIVLPSLENCERAKTPKQKK